MSFSESVRPGGSGYSKAEVDLLIAEVQTTIDNHGHDKDDGTLTGFDEVADEGADPVPAVVTALSSTPDTTALRLRSLVFYYAMIAG